MCGCVKKGAKPSPWSVKLPGAEGRIKTYAAEQTARAVNEKIPGSILIPPGPAAS